MRMICSAYVAGATPKANAIATQLLLASVHEFDLELVHGCFDGQLEVAVVCTGFHDVQHLTDSVKKVCDWFDQSCVYYSIENVGYLYHSDGRHQTIGAEKEYPAELAHSPIFRRMYKNFTVFCDGSVIAATNELKAVA